MAVAKERGFQADYVTYIGKSGWSVWNLASYALENDYIFVTNNRPGRRNREAEGTRPRH